MGQNSAIEWTETTWNPLTGCTRVSAGCDNCYAARQAATRLKTTAAYHGLAIITPSGRAAFNGSIRLLPERLEQPLHWRKPRRVFVNSMSDLFHPDVPFQFIVSVFVTMALAGRHTFQVLTKRPERGAKLLNDPEFREDVEREIAMRFDGIHREIMWPLPNVWLGTSVEGQAAADERIPHLLRTPAAVRFLSCEPLLGPLSLHGWLRTCCCGHMEFEHDPFGVHQCEECSCDSGRWSPAIHWVIVGGESGPGARPMGLEWARDLVGQCREASTPVFVKQLGAVPVTGLEPTGDFRTDPITGKRQFAMKGLRYNMRDRKGGDPEEWPADLRVRQFPEVAHA